MWYKGGKYPVLRAAASAAMMAGHAAAWTSGDLDKMLVSSAVTCASGALSFVAFGALIARVKYAEGALKTLLTGTTFQASGASLGLVI